MTGKANYHDAPPPKQARGWILGAPLGRFVRAMITTQVDVADVGKSPYKRAY
jgi:hypothetical protein